MLTNLIIIYNILRLISNLVILGDWGLGIGDWGLPNPQSPIPNPHLIKINNS